MRQGEWGEMICGGCFFVEQAGFAGRISKSYGGLPPDFLSSLVALVNLMRSRPAGTAHVVVGECRVAGNPGRPSFLAHVRSHGMPGQVGERGAPVQSPPGLLCPLTISACPTLFGRCGTRALQPRALARSFRQSWHRLPACKATSRHPSQELLRPSRARPDSHPPRPPG